MMNQTEKKWQKRKTKPKREKKFSIKNNCWTCYKSDIMLIEYDGIYRDFFFILISVFENNFNLISLSGCTD